ncbi:hypothetical protein PVAG01_04500 [Phlyctema vagabunda]|uniref:Uncharacterized protein n=1 Tax=Phlyctema vagabunda TaxID=108571 RepID=A0ABR4PPE6_9HELO
MGSLINLVKMDLNHSPDILEAKIRFKLESAHSKRQFLKPIFELDVPLSDTQLEDLNVFFDYYQQQCEGMSFDAKRTHRQVVTLINKLKRSSINQSSDPVLYIESQAAEQKQWTCFAARVFTMTDIDRPPQNFIPHQFSQHWEKGCLKEFLEEKVFPKERQLSDNIKLDKVFNARNLERLASLNVIWTSNLADHLQLADDIHSVKIFTNVSFLKLHQHSNVFPPGFIEETIRTISLLLPANDKATARWFQKKDDDQASQSGLNCAILSSLDRRIEKFEYWHDRLVMLKDAFDLAEPKSVRQWWSDRRRPVQWYNFWFAIGLVIGITVFFGVIQSVEGALQVYKAYHPS